MTIAELQQWLADHGQAIIVDGKPGPATRAAIKAAFVNLDAPAVSDVDIAQFAAQIGCSPKQMKAVATVESAGGGFTDEGRPKILFERHHFWRLTEGRFGVTAYSNRKGGGYDQPSWSKLCDAACKDPHAAFSSASWGKFQIMGSHWSALGYISPIAMAYTMTRSEADHYEALVRFIKANGLEAKIRAISTNPDANRPFCKAYNGTGYERNDYHNKLARAMR